jgi:hypothetical protein
VIGSGGEPRCASSCMTMYSSTLAYNIHGAWGWRKAAGSGPLREQPINDEFIVVGMCNVSRMMEESTGSQNFDWFMRVPCVWSCTAYARKRGSGMLTGQFPALCSLCSPASSLPLFLPHNPHSSSHSSISGIQQLMRQPLSCCLWAQDLGVPIAAQYRNKREVI